MAEGHHHMRWPWPWGRRAEPVDPDVEREQVERTQQAVEAVATAEQALREVRSKWPEVNQRAEAMRRIREQNHLAELVRRNLRGRHA